MIRITMELVSARTGQTTILGIGVIANDGTRTRISDGRFGNYRVQLSKREPKQGETWKRSEVIDFPRKSRGAWDLLYLALRNAVGSRNP